MQLFSGTFTTVLHPVHDGVNGKTVNARLAPVHAAHVELPPASAIHDICGNMTPPQPEAHCACGHVHCTNEPVGAGVGAGGGANVVV